MLLFWYLCHCKTRVSKRNQRFQWISSTLARLRYDETVDVFAFGTLVWEVVSVEIPHANLDPSDIAQRGATKEGGARFGRFFLNCFFG